MKPTNSRLLDQFEKVGSQNVQLSCFRQRERLLGKEMKMRKVLMLVLALSIGLVGSMVQAQITTGAARGVVKDQNGAVVPGAKVTITDPNTKISQSAQSGSSGEYQFNNLPAGNYTVTVEPPSGSNFSTLTVNDVKVVTSQVTDIPSVLQPGQATASVTVSAGGAELVDTTTVNLAKDFSSRQVVDLAQTGQGAGVYNLALISPNVVSSGGIGLGTGGSVGGQRPRNNNFVVDGIDNNDKTVSGPQIYVSPESIAEFNVITNQASAEFARSTGGQFVTTTKSGTNGYHGTFYEFLRNRRLNALDNLQKIAGTTRATNPRFDYNRFGFNIGGPVYVPRFGEGGKHWYPWSGKNRTFFFFEYERINLGQAASAGGITAPTAAGVATLAGLNGNSATNFNIFRQYVPVAPANDAGIIRACNGTYNTAGVCTGALVNVPVGNINFAAPNFAVNKNWVLNFDFNQSSKTQHHSRFIHNSNPLIDNAASLPIFFILIPIEGRLFSYTLTHNFTSTFTNETRLAYRRYNQTIPVPNLPFPGLDVFPNIGLNELGLNIGPDGNAPQFTIENSYQIVDQATWVKGKHAVKFGADWRNIISPQSFVQRQRGDYEYSTLDLFLKDVTPDFLAERTVGSSPYYGNQHLFYAFIQDDWKLRPNLTANLGLNYVFQQVPFTARLQSLNAIASVPGLITFNEPKPQKKNFAPRVGFAWSPNYTSGWGHRLFGNPDQTSVRASFAMAYDTIVDNLFILSLPPQFNTTVDSDVNSFAPNYLARGGIPPGTNAGPACTTGAACRAITSAWIPDQQVPYSLSWSGSIQREFRKNWSLELRYLASRGVHLPTQNRLNVQPKVFNGPGGSLPTFFSRPSQASLDALTTTLAQINARSNKLPNYLAAGFTSNVIGFLADGNSTYHAGSASLTRRFSHGMQLNAAYTWSHLIDDTTAEVFSTVLSPRRVQDFQNLRPERADSALDHRQRFVLSSLYDLPFFNKSSNHLARTILGGFRFAGTLTYESGEKATVLSNVDSNLNGDTAPDRTIINPSGTPNTASTVTALTRTDGQVVGYLANNPSAFYIQAGRGTIANAGRNTLQLPPIKNLDFSIFKDFKVKENMKFQLRADLYNAFNHPQYVPGSIDGVEPIGSTGVTNLIAVTSNQFNQPSLILSSHPRVIQLGVRFSF
jgi:Carboxypeptidase regulatory-like domain